MTYRDYFQSKLAAAELSGKQTLDAGIAVHAVLPVSIVEPADRAKNIVGEFKIVEISDELLFNQ